MRTVREDNKEGRGQGKGAGYKPWFRTGDESSLRHRDLAKRRYEYVAEIFRREIPKMTPKALRQLIQEVARAIGDPAPPSWSALRSWHQRFVSSGGKVRSLILSSREQRKRVAGLNPEVARLIEDKFLRAYVRPGCVRIREIWAFVARDIRKMNCLRTDGDKFTVPSYSTVRREVRKLYLRRDLPRPCRQRVASWNSASLSPRYEPTLPYVNDVVDRPGPDFVVSHPGDLAAGLCRENGYARGRRSTGVVREGRK